MSRHRVLVIDDSRTMRQLIAGVLAGAPDIEVVGFASNAQEGREAIKQLDPDVVTLDIEMPGMDGLSFLEKIMTLRPTPVVMISSLADNNMELVLQALAIGAIDCIAKPRGGEGALFPSLTRIVREAATTTMRSVPARPTAKPHVAPRSRGFTPDGQVVAIGSSAGGVDALAAVLEGFPSNCPPVVIAQHMPAMFTEKLAARLDRLCDARVTEAQDGAPLLPGTIHVAPGGSHHLQVAGKGPYHCRLRAGPEVTGHRPSVDVLFRSVARAAGARSVGVILTGMGQDGAAGLLDMRKAGSSTIGQDEATCFIYGMPRVAFEAGAVSRQLPLQGIGPAILATTNQKVSLSCR